jgi:BASS family bile acid:Na+ symporter
MWENYARYEYFLALTQLLLFMAAMGATLPLGDFAVVFRQPRDLLYGLAVQLLVTPLVAVAVHRLFDLPAEIAFGLILVMALPGGTLKNVMTYLARGNVALSIAMSALGTVLAIGTIPLVLSFLAYEYVPAEFAMPVSEIVQTILLPILLPLLGGMFVVRLWPRWRRWFARSCLYLGLGFAGLMVLSSLVRGDVGLGSYGWQVQLAIILTCVIGQQLIMLPYRLLRWPDTSCAALGVEATFRNINLALMLKVALFQGNQGQEEVRKGVYFVILYFGAVGFGAGLPLVLRMRWSIRKRRRKALAESSASL